MCIVLLIMEAQIEQRAKMDVQWKQSSVKQ